ncbi:MAG: RNA methyltransferase [Gemmatimonadetes bacterium]|nr:RNA methyltransferase [Gemmatimonadota bacterium]MCC7133523.1 RNA methyltransferase [Gemmatimonadales bacterium]
MGHALHTMIRDLHRRRGRERRGLVLAEGVRLVEEVVATGLECRAVLVSPTLRGTERGRALEASVRSRGLPIEETGDEELAKLAATEHPQGVLAVVRPKVWALDDLGVAADAVYLVLDGLQDPGNVGTIVRTALALGAAGVIALPGTAELGNPKTLRASMGALFRFPGVVATEEAAAEWLAAHRVTVAATAMDGLPFESARLPKKVAFVLGNEGAGVASRLAREAALKLAIPLAPGAESLNVAVAAGIFLYGACRDR